MRATSAGARPGGVDDPRRVDGGAVGKANAAHDVTVALHGHDLAGSIGDPEGARLAAKRTEQRGRVEPALAREAE